MKVIADYQKLSLLKKTMFKTVTDFLNALNDIHSFFINCWWSEQKKRTYIIFLKIVNKFRDLYVNKILILNFFMFVIWQNKFADSLKKNNDEKDKKQRKFNFNTISCICDSKHQFEDCLYVMKVKKQREWKLNEKIIENFQKRMIKSIKIWRRIEKL